MRVTLIALALTLGLAHGDEPKVDGAKAEMKKLEGAWVWTHMSRKGFKVSLPADSVIIFGADGTVVQKEKGEPEKKNTYRVDPSKTPREMDFFYPDGKPNILAVYELDGDTLRFAACDGDDSTKRRLGKLDADDAYIWYLKRQKK
jgi:uncharacterized protein (TIGR03067 family)